MENIKLKIYKGMIQYLLKSTNYTLENIADLSNSSIKNIRSIYRGDSIPASFASELQLVQLYHLILEFEIKKRNFLHCIVQEKTNEHLQY